MRSRKLYFILILVLAVLVLLFFIFKGFFLGIFNINAQIISESSGKDVAILESRCSDTDSMNIFEKGYRSFEGNIKEDFCLVRDSTGNMYVKEYYCYGEVIQKCPGECLDGACVGNMENQEKLSNFIESAKHFFKTIF